MTDRRRNLFILLLVVGLMAGSFALLATKDTKLGLDLQGGVSLVYQAKPTKEQPTLDAESLDRAVDIIRERVDALGVAEPEIARSGADQIEVSLPSVQNAEDAADRVGTTAQMYFYDWEPNVLDEDCKTNPNEVNGGQQAIAGFYRAVQRAAKCEPYTESGTNASAERWYAFGKGNKVLNGGLAEPTEADLREAVTQDRERLKKSDPDAAEATDTTFNAVKVPEGILIVRQERPDVPAGRPPAAKPDAWFVIRDKPALSGTDIKNPEQNFDQTSQEPIVTMEFTDKGKKAFHDTTRAIATRGADNALPTQNPIEGSHHFAIVLDNELVSRPYINFEENPDGIDGETGAQISGGFTLTGAQDLAKFLKIGALPIELELISRSQVSATLGQQALDQGLKAGIAGFIIVALFLIIFYRVLGLIAVSALLVYGLYFYALVELIPVVMTLPGIAGMILTLGVAADANIVIFERTKEEIRRGRSVGAAIAEGYKKGFATIIDANVCTLLVAFILFILATAGVKGFAFMLGLGTIVSLFTAVLATQAILLSLRGTRLLATKDSLGAGSTKDRWRLNFMGASRWFFSMSGVILLIGALAIAGKGLNFGIDFESGTRIKAALEQSVSVDQVRDVMQEAGYPSAEVQTLEDPEIGENVVQISTGSLAPPEVDKVENALEQEFGVADSSSDSIGPTFGESIANAAIVAIIASLTVIAVYLTLRFEWKFAVPTLIALMHDILITGGVYALVGREVTASTVAALLTILGFSLYDTIIVFDRIRENVPRMPSAAFSQIVNRSMSEVLTRSIATSFCTILPVLGLLLFGGETLKDFALALIVGTASGTYSSVFIAGPLLSKWKEREPVYRARHARIEAEFGHIPAYATPLGGTPVDVAPEKRRGRRGGFGPADPAQGVSQEEFEDLVANLGVDTQPVVAPPRQRPAGGRRGRPAVDTPPKQTPPAEGDGGDGDAKPRKPRNRKHGRAR